MLHPIINQVGVDTQKEVVKEEKRRGENRPYAKLFDIIPDVLKEHGKAKNPWPNVDAASGSLLHYYGLKEFEFYTVLFSMSRSLGIVSQVVLARAMGLPLTRPKSLTFDALNQL